MSNKIYELSVDELNLVSGGCLAAAVWLASAFITGVGAGITGGFEDDKGFVATAARAGRGALNK